MFGVFFVNYFDFCCIMIDYGFEGYFLCKDFFFIGYIEIRYDEEKKCIVIEFLEFM